MTDTAPAVTSGVDDAVEPDTSAAPVSTSAPAPSDIASTEPIGEPTDVDPSTGPRVAGVSVDSEPIDVTRRLFDTGGAAFSADWQVPWKGGFLVGRAGNGGEIPWTTAISADGLDWAPIELDPGLPASFVTVASTGDRLVVIGSSWEPGNVPPVVADTTNLSDWDVTEIPVRERTADLPDIVEVSTWIREIAVNESGWIATIENSYQIDSIAFAEARTGQTVTGVSMNWSDDGIRLLVNPDADGSGGRVLDVTWDELENEIGADLVATIRSAQPPEVWTGTWSDTTPVRHDIPTDVEDSWISDVVAVDDGFVVVRSVQVLRPDAPARERNELVASLGGEWTVLEAPIEGDVISVFPLDGDVGVIVQGADESISVHRVDVESQAWTPIDVPDLPATARYIETSGTAAVRLDAAPVQRFDDEPTTGTVEQDGLRYTWTFDAPISSYEVVSIETGEVLVAESIDIGDVSGSFELSFDHLVGGIGATTISDPATGAVLMDISADVVQAANPTVVDDEEPEPEPWIVASADGEHWYVDRAPPLVDDSGFFVDASATLSGTRVLIGLTSGEWFVVDLA